MALSGRFIGLLSSGSLVNLCRNNVNAYDHLVSELFCLRLNPSTNLSITSVRSIVTEKNAIQTSTDDIPVKPKLPMNAFIEFLQNNHAKVRTTQGTDYKTTLKIVGEMWQNLSPTEKERYLARYRQRKVKYTKEMDLWKEQAPFRPKTREDKGQEKPKKPPSIFLKFKNGLERKADENHKEFMKRASAEYHQLPEEKVRKFKDDYLVQMENYRNSLVLWKEQNDRGKGN